MSKNKLLSQCIITGSVVFNVKSMNNIKEINKIGEELKETNRVINDFTKNMFLESLNVYNLNGIYNTTIDEGRCKIDGELSYKDTKLLEYKNSLDTYKSEISNIFNNKSLFFYQIDDYFLQYVQLNFLNTIFNINNGDNIFRKLLNFNLDVFKNKKYLFYDFLDEITSQNFPNLKIENIVKNINEYLKSNKYVEYDYFYSSDYFKKKDLVVLGLTYFKDDILSIGVVQGLTYCKKNFLFYNLDETPINGFSELILEMLNNDLIFKTLADRDLLKNVNNIDKYAFLYQYIKGFIDLNTHEFDHFIYDIYECVFDYYSKLNTKEAMFLGEYDQFYSIFSFNNITDLDLNRINDENNFKDIMKEFAILLDLYFDDNNKKNDFIKNVYEMKICTRFVEDYKKDHKEDNMKLLLPYNMKICPPFSTYSLKDHKMSEFYAELLSKYIVSNINNGFIFELLKLRYFYIIFQINNLIKNKKL